MGFDLVFKTNKMPTLSASVSSALAKVVEETAATVEGRAKEGAPVDTGNLRNSITHETSGLTATVSVGADYAANVELGTVHRGAQPFLTPAVEAERDGFKERVAGAITQAAK